MRGHKNFKAAWYQNGLILMKIRDDGDYKEIYGTFKNYIEERWGFNEKQGYRLLNAAELTQKIAQISSRGLTTNGAKTYAKEFQLDLMV